MLIASVNYGLWVDSKIQNRVILIKNCSVCVCGVLTWQRLCVEREDNVYGNPVLSAY